jgi:hypothetical protein
VPIARLIMLSTRDTVFVLKVAACALIVWTVDKLLRAFSDVRNMRARGGGSGGELSAEPKDDGATEG